MSYSMENHSHRVRVRFANDSPDSRDAANHLYLDVFAENVNVLPYLTNPHGLKLRQRREANLVRVRKIKPKLGWRDQRTHSAQNNMIAEHQRVPHAGRIRIAVWFFCVDPLTQLLTNVSIKLNVNHYRPAHYVVIFKL